MLIPFSPPPGLNGDDSAYAAEGRWEDGDDFRFHQGKAETVNSVVEAGFSSGFTNHVNQAFAMHAFENGGTNYLAYGMTRQLAVSTLAGGTGSTPQTPSTILASALGATSYRWSLDSWGENLLACPRGGTIYEWTGTGNAAAIGNAPDNINVMLVDPVRRQVLAFGCNEASSGTFNGLCFRCSDAEDNTDWSPSASNLSDEIVFYGGGEFVAAKFIGDFVLAWTSTSMFLGQFTGDASQPWRFDRVEGGVGCVDQEAATVMEGVAYWLAPNKGFYRYVPGVPPSPIPCPISRAFIADSSQVLATYPIRCVAARRRGEVFWFYKGNANTSATGTLGNYVAYAVAESQAAQRPVWFKGSVEVDGVFSSPLLDSLTTEPPDIYITNKTSGGTTDGFASASLQFWHFSSPRTTGALPIGTAYIQSADQYLDNGQRRMMIRRYIPDFEFLSTEGTVDLTLFVRDRPRSTAVTKGPYEITDVATKKDFRASGKLVAAKFSTTFNCRLGKQIFDVVPMGER